MFALFPQFVLGKFAGLVLTLVINLLVMTVAFYAVLAYLGWATPSVIAAASERATRP